MTPSAPPHRWPPSGFLHLDRLLEAPVVDALARGVAALRTHGLHPTFLYVYDEPWRVLGALLPRLSPWLGTDIDVLADVWAWHIDPRTDRGGWPIHRGWYEEVRDTAGAPALVNTWIALTDATERNACMHLVPLESDPHHPDDLHNLSDLEPRGLALPTPTGSALVWNGNMAHWGGRCDPSFDQPRISMSFTLRTPAFPAVSALPNMSVVRLPLAFRERLDLIAAMFGTYGEKELAPQGHEMRWAAMVNAMRLAAGPRP